MQNKTNSYAADAQPRRRLYVYNGGFLTNRRVRRILHLSGYDIKLGKPTADDFIGIWGNSPTAHRGKKMADRTGAKILHVEDAYLRSLHPARSHSEPPLGLFIDAQNIHFDPTRPSDLEHLLATHPLDNTALLNDARAAMARLKQLHLSKYNAFDPATPVPDPGYVLVIDQVRGDASVTASGANQARFLEMLVFAQEEHPGCKVIIKTHPETTAGQRSGYFNDSHCSDRVSLLDAPVSPWALFEGAVAVYTVSSQLGFEAIFAGHKPRVFGQPFYAGWGLTQDDAPVDRRQRNLTRAQLFAAAMILYPKWYDPFTDQLCTLSRATDILHAKTSAWRQDNGGHIAVGMRLWKRAHLQHFFGASKKLRFENPPEKAVAKAKATNSGLMVWAGKETSDLAAAGVPLLRIEDGFLRSNGLGAALTPPLSLVADDLGIYYDPTRESRLDRLISTCETLPPDALRRSERLISSITKAGLSKYNVGQNTLPDLPKGRRILVPGQVEDDASIQKGCGDINTNLALLQRARADNPDAVILYKPHPDVEAGLRTGIIPPETARQYADVILDNCDPIALINQVDEIWTLTSLLGFEALLRGKTVTCLGTPFYAGWGLTTDLGEIPDRRVATPSLSALVHATLIDYPRYFDPVTKQPCPVEVVVERLQNNQIPSARIGTRALAKLQGVFASYAHLWR